MPLYSLLHLLYRLRFVILYPYDTLRPREELQNALESSYQIIAVLQHASVIRGQIGLALGSVHYDMIYPVRLLR